MKKFITTVLVMSTALVLASCGNKNEQNPATPVPEDEIKSEDTKLSEDADVENAKDDKNTETDDKNAETDSTNDGSNPLMEAYDFIDAPFTQLEPLKEGEMYAVIETSMGDVKVKFLPDCAPLAVENFVTLSEQGYYDGLIFHRVINDFVIQSGDPLGTGFGGQSIYEGGVFDNEISISARHFNGALAMANSGEDTNGSQFYIVEAGVYEDAEFVSYLEGLKADLSQEIYDDGNGNKLYAEDFYTTEIVDAYLERGGYMPLDFGYTVFGQVVEGMDIVSAIAETPVNEDDKPIEDVIINKITIYNAK